MEQHVATLVKKAADSSHGIEAKSFAEAALAAAEAMRNLFDIGISVETAEEPVKVEPEDSTEAHDAEVAEAA